MIRSSAICDSYQEFLALLNRILQPSPRGVQRILGIVALGIPCSFSYRNREIETKTTREVEPFDCPLPGLKPEETTLTATFVTFIFLRDGFCFDDDRSVASEFSSLDSSVFVGPFLAVDSRLTIHHSGWR